MAASTYHTYPDLLYIGGRLACTEWSPRCNTAEVVAATLRLDSEAVILRANTASGHYRGLAPGGLG